MKTKTIRGKVYTAGGERTVKREAESLAARYRKNYGYAATITVRNFTGKRRNGNKFSVKPYAVWYRKK